MLRVKGGIVICKCCKKVFKLVKGYFGLKYILYKVVNQQVMKFGNYVFCDCCQKKCDFCKFWIICINVVVCMNGFFYSCLMYGFKFFGIEVNCKMFVDFVVNDFIVFNQFVDVVKV